VAVPLTVIHAESQAGPLARGERGGDGGDERAEPFADEQPKRVPGVVLPIPPIRGSVGKLSRRLTARRVPPFRPRA